MSFTASLGSAGSSAVLHLAGRLTDADVRTLRTLVDQAVGTAPRRLLVDAHDLESLAPAGVRCLAFAQQHLAPGTEMVIEGASPDLHEALARAGLTRSMTVVTTTTTASAAA
ncbi:STAS domain-containing protein [Streptomyces hainanensis]|uniref:Anti-sigma factor antagonist n=1 Tax=Streptomyces hainanensis TaxID=402648 RepID=A0A4R4SK09_9ACTN|nr:STAS domain-containing protein [Streptomyces hainanensis]TDC62579.1 anti-sigma factor antagonist [Streptomyces hainanensis]